MFYWELWDIPWHREHTELNEDDATDVDHDPWDRVINKRAQAPLRPLQRSCPQQSQKSIPVSRYCSTEKSLEDCYRTLMPIFHKKVSWVFLGDESMGNIPYFLSLQWPVKNLTISTRRNPCQNLAYYGLAPPDTGWKEPNPDLGEGPIGIGMKRHFCMDCRKCWNVAMESGPTDQDLSVEYLVVEYARDVSLQSRTTTTTQQTVAYYLGQKQSRPSVCVASAGINDAAIQPLVPEEIYIQNVDKYLGLLQRTCEYVIWIGLHAVVENENLVVQKNCHLETWNDAMIELIKKRNYRNVFFVDIFERSFHSDFEFPTRLGKKFYASLSRLFKSLIAGPDILIA